MNRISACVITHNEESNLPRLLDSLAGVADEIVVVDSGSTDATVPRALARGAKLFARGWTNFSDQRNFAAARASHDWIFAFDADEELSGPLRESLLAWKACKPAAAAYEVARRANYLGVWIRHSGWYPDWKIRLYHRARARFAGAVHESLRVEGPVARLAGDLLHYTIRTKAEHREKIERYTSIAARELFEAKQTSWRLPMVFGSAWTFFQTFFLRAGLLDGWRGGMIARMAARYVWEKYRKLGDLVRLSRSAKNQ
ncbi:MAG: glycosyltransferase family 2 protein [Candidatus Acidiferrales bacterium]